MFPYFQNNVIIIINNGTTTEAQVLKLGTASAKEDADIDCFPPSHSISGDYHFERHVCLKLKLNFGRK